MHVACIQKRKWMGISKLTSGLIIGADEANLVMFLSDVDCKNLNKKIKQFLSLTKLDSGVFMSSSVLIQTAASASIFTPV